MQARFACTRLEPQWSDQVEILQSWRGGIVEVDLVCVTSHQLHIV